MITCPNCGTQNEQGDRFCRECGADLRALNAPPTTPQALQPSAPPQFPVGDMTPPQDQWQSAPIVPTPPPGGRRTWLWILVGLLAACLLFCCVGGLYFSTSSGQEHVKHWATRLSDYATETAPTPER